MSNLLLIASAALCNTLALVLLKMAGKGFQHKVDIWSFVQQYWYFIFGGAGLYGLSFILTIKILSDNLFLAAVPTFVGINFFFTVLVSLFFFKEPILLSSLVGVGFIFLGVWLISTGSL